MENEKPGEGYSVLIAAIFLVFILAVAVFVNYSGLDTWLMTL